MQISKQEPGFQRIRQVSEIKRTRQQVIIIKPTDAEITDEESDTLNNILAVLSAKQINAARMEASGYDAMMVASSIKVHPQTITTWRKNPDYIKAREFFVAIVNRSSLKFRIDCQRQIMAPAYAELMRRMMTPRIRMGLDHKELLETIKIMGKETRLDGMVAGEATDDDELRDILKRRKEFSYAKQAQAVENLKDNSKVISFPTGTDGV